MRCLMVGMVILKNFLICVWWVGLVCAGYSSDDAPQQPGSGGAAANCENNARCPHNEDVVMHLLRRAAQNGCSAVLFRSLINTGCTLSEIDWNRCMQWANSAGENLFMLSVKSGCFFGQVLDCADRYWTNKNGILKALLERDNVGNTLLMHAILSQSRAGMQQIISAIYSLSPKDGIDLIKAVNVQGLNVFMYAANGCALYPDKTYVLDSIRLLFSYVRREERAGLLAYRAKGCGRSTLEYLAECFFPKQIIYDSECSCSAEGTAVFEIKTVEEINAELLSLPEAEGGLFREKLSEVELDVLAQMA